MTFKVLKTVTIDGEEFQLVENESGRKGIRYRYDNEAGHTSRLSPTIWLDTLPSFMRAVFELTTVEIK